VEGLLTGLTGKDVEAVNHFVNGEYEALFEIDQNELSDTLYSFIVTNIQSWVILGEKAPQELMDFVNGLMHNIHPDGHLTRLSQISAMELKQIIDVQLALNGAEADEELTGLMQRLSGLNNLFE